MIIPGSASQTLAAALADHTGIPLATVASDRFPDGELLVELPDAIDDRAIIVASTVSSEAHLEVLLLQDAAREAGVNQLTTVIPYLGYARQDAAFEPGQPVSARAVARAISTGTDRVLAVNPHEPAVMDFFTVPARATSAATQLAGPLPTDLTNPLFLAPDSGARDLVTEVRDAYGRGEVDHFEKTRRSGRAVEIAPSDARVADRDVVVADDIIATGGTMSEAIGVLREGGADRVYAACVHPLLTDAARTRLAQAGVAAIVATDTVERPASTVSAAPIVADAVRAFEDS